MVTRCVSFRSYSRAYLLQNPYESAIGHHTCQRRPSPPDESSQVAAVRIGLAAGSALLDLQKKTHTSLGHSGGDQVCLQFLWSDVPVLNLGPSRPRNRFGHVIHGEARWGEPGHMCSYGSDSATT